MTDIEKISDSSLQGAVEFTNADRDLTKNSRENRLKKTANELISEISLHSVGKIFGVDKSLISRFVWTIVSIVSLTYCILYILRNVNEYYQYPVITNIKRVYEKEPEFPVVEVCFMRTFYCAINGKICPSTLNHGNCRIFNRGKDKDDHELPIQKSEGPGQSKGIFLGLEFGTADILLYVHNQSESANRDKAIRISPGMDIHLVLSRGFESKLGYPYSNCKAGYTFDLGPDDHYNRSVYPYYQSECFYLCPFQKFYEAINKTEEYFQNFQYYFTYYNKWVLSTANNLDFIYKPMYPDIYSNIENQYLKEKHKYCQDICPIECNLISYTFTPYDKPRDQPFTRVWIYYEDLTYTEITEIPKISADNLFANIGGILGLFLGASLMSLVEIPEFILIMTFEIAKNLVCRKKTTTNQRPNVK